MELEERITALTLSPKGEPLFSEYITSVSIDDEAGGEFVRIQQFPEGDVEEIRIDPAEWPAIRSAVDKMVAACRSSSE